VSSGCENRPAREWGHSYLYAFLSERSRGSGKEEEEHPRRRSRFGTVSVCDTHCIYAGNDCGGWRCGGAMGEDATRIELI
jgi:hypothetical protein